MGSFVVAIMGNLIEMVSLFAPELLFFCLAGVGMALFSRGTLGPLVAQLLLGQSPPAKKVLETDAEALTVTTEQEADKALQAALAAGNHAEAIRIWRDWKFVMKHPHSMMLVDLRTVLQASGTMGADAFVMELQQACEKNPALCENGEAMECLLLSLDAADGKDLGVLAALVSALEEVDRVSPKMRSALCGIALRSPEEAGLTGAIEHLLQLPPNTKLSTDMASRLLRRAADEGRLPAAAAGLADLQLNWPENALEAPMGEAAGRCDSELCIQLFRTAAMLDIPKTAAVYEELLGCLEEAGVPPSARRTMAEEVAQDPYLEISQGLETLLKRAGLDNDPRFATKLLASTVHAG